MKPKKPVAAKKSGQSPKATVAAQPNLEARVIQGALLLAGAETLVSLTPEERASDAYLQMPLIRIGVRDANGALVENGTDIYRSRASTPIEAHLLTCKIAKMAGRAIYGGVAGPQFGHLITQSLGRIWIAEQEPKTPIVFLSANAGFDKLPDYFTALIRALGIKNPLRLITKPTQVGELVVAQDRCNLERRPAVSPQFAQWLAQRRPTTPIDEEVSVYVSRSQLGAHHGQYLQETLLENAFKSLNYQVIYPEKMPITQQIDIFSRAKRLVFADGSAIHLWSLFAREQQVAALIWRRTWNRNLFKWFLGLDQANPSFIDHGIADFSKTGGSTGTSVRLLDLQQVWRKLRKQGFHRNREEMGAPRDQLDAWMEQIYAGADPIESAPFELDDLSRELLATRPRAKPRV